MLSFPELEPVEYGTAAGLFEAYEAWCNFYQCKPSADFKRHVEDLVQAGSEELDLTKCPGIEPKMEYSFQLEPILNALRYNTYFRSFIVRNVPRKEVLPLFANTLDNNTYITRVVLSGVDSGPEGCVGLQITLKHRIKQCHLDMKILLRFLIDEKQLKSQHNYQLEF